MDESPEPKISLVVGILGLIITVILDLLSLIPFIGDIEEVPAGLTFVLSFIFGADSPIMIAIGIAMIIKAIPVLQELPLWTAAWIFTWYTENHPSQLTAVVKEIAEEEAKAQTGGAEAEIGESAAATAATQTENVAATEAASAEVGAIEQGSAATGEVGEAAQPKTETSADRGDMGKESREAAEKAEGRPSETPEPATETHEGAGDESEEGAAGEQRKDELEEEMQSESEQDPEEVARKKLFEETPGAEANSAEEEDEEEEEEEPPKMPIPIDRNKKAEDEKRQLNAPKVGREATGDQDRDDLQKAA